MSAERAAEHVTHGEVPALMKGLAPVIRDYVERAQQSLLQRIEALENQAFTYTGTWEVGRSYRPNMFCTHNGALWCCRRATAAQRPGDGDAWQMAVKSR